MTKGRIFLLSPTSYAGERARLVLSGKARFSLGVFGDRLRFPTDFVGRGDMSRGSLMLRCVEEGRELEYVLVAGAARHGPRPPKLERRA